MKDDQQHARQGSTGSNDSYGNSYNQMMGRVFENVGNKEISLRTLYAVNHAAYHQPKHSARRLGGNSHSPMSSTDGQLTIQGYTQSLLEQLTNLPKSAASLPPSFINTFTRRCFPKELEHVDFNQALTALDYLKDLEERRNRDFANILQRVGIQRNAMTSDYRDVCENQPLVAALVQKLQLHDHRATQLYSQLWIALRRWILINEFCTTPFNKQNCSAMLNTLYIPSPTRQPTATITPGLLNGQRDGFLRLMDQVGRNGPSAVNRLKEQNARPGDSNGWPAVHELVDAYLRCALFVIEECTRALFDDTLEPVFLQKKKSRGKQVDSGVSFGHESRASSGSAHSTTKQEKAESIRQLRPTTPASESYQPKTPGKSGLGGFSKFMRQRFTPSRRKTEEMMVQENIEERPPSAASSLRKMRSLGNLGRRNTSQVNVSTTRDDAPAFDVEEMQRQRALYEARQQQYQHQDNGRRGNQWG